MSTTYYKRNVCVWCGGGPSRKYKDVQKFRGPLLLVYETLRTWWEPLASYGRSVHYLAESKCYDKSIWTAAHLPKSASISHRLSAMLISLLR